MARQILSSKFFRSDNSRTSKISKCCKNEELKCLKFQHQAEKTSRFLDGKGAKQFKTDKKFHKIGIETLSDSHLRISFMNFAALLIIA